MLQELISFIPPTSLLNELQWLQYNGSLNCHVQCQLIISMFYVLLLFKCISLFPIQMKLCFHSIYWFQQQLRQSCISKIHHQTLYSSLKIWDEHFEAVSTVHFAFHGLQKWIFSDSLLDSKRCREKVESEGVCEAHWWEPESKVGEKVKETDVENHLGMDECSW